MQSVAEIKPKAGKLSKADEGRSNALSAGWGLINKEQLLKYLQLPAGYYRFGKKNRVSAPVEFSAASHRRLISSSRAF